MTTKNNKSRIKGLILSAGESSRMGTPKALLRFPSGETLLEDQYRRLRESGITDIYVVVGCDADKIKSAHPDIDVHWVMNDNWRLGNFSSIVSGLKAVWPAQRPATTCSGGPPCPPACLSIILLPVDVAGVEVEIIRQIIDEGIKTGKNVIPTYNSKGGHPVYIRTETIKTILSYSPKDGRLDHILNSDPDTKRIEVVSRSILDNINTREDWENCLCHPEAKGQRI